MRCEALHPEDPTRSCLMPRDHRTAAHLDAEGSWPNQPVQEEAAERRLHRIDAKAQHQRAITLAAEVAASRRQSGYTLPIARTDDPDSSHEAARRYQPRRESAKGRVLAYLQAHLEQWVDASDLNLSEVGGDEGKRRMRELREAGWPIEGRPKPGHPTAWQHRLMREKDA